MKNFSLIKKILIFLGLLAPAAFYLPAQSAAQTLDGLSTVYEYESIDSVNQYAQSLFAGGGSKATPNDPSPAHNLGIIHRYLGYATIAVAATAALTGSASHSVHRGAAYTATFLGTATCVTGFMEYRDIIDFRQPFSRLSSHAILGTIGTIGFAAAVAVAEGDSSHSGIGVGGASAMALSVIRIHF